MKKLSTEYFVKNVLLSELKDLIYNHKGAPFFKFMNLAIGIEYLGACLDNHGFTESGYSEERFKNAIKKLFSKKYLKFSKKDNNFYLYENFRCAFIHQLKPGNNILVTHRNEAKIEGTTHLQEIKEGKLILILEDFFDDFEIACKKLITLDNKGKLPSKKMHEDYINVISIKNNKETRLP